MKHTKQKKGMSIAELTIVTACMGVIGIGTFYAVSKVMTAAKEHTQNVEVSDRTQYETKMMKDFTEETSTNKKETK